MILRLALVLAPKTGDITLMYAYPRCLIKYVVPASHLFGFINLPASTFSTRRSTIAPKMPRYTYGLVAVCIAHLLSGCGGGGGGGLAVSDVPVVEEEGRFDVNDRGARTYTLNEGGSDSIDSLEPSDFETDE